jgi:hypothetical protein
MTDLMPNLLLKLVIRPGEETGDIPAFRVRRHDIRPAVVIEIPDGNGVGCIADRVTQGVVKCAGRAGNEAGDVIAVYIGRDDIQSAVTVEVTEGN